MYCLPSNSMKQGVWEDICSDGQEIEPEGSLGCQEDSATGPYPESEEFSPHPHLFL
jgi:hypothetical protein